MALTREEISEIIRVVDEGQDRIEDLKQQRDRLFEANQRLVELVKQLEVALQEVEGGSVKFEGSEYSFEGGWMPTNIIHDKNLDLSADIDLDELDTQVSEVLKSMKEIEDLKEEIQD